MIVNTSFAAEYVNKYAFLGLEYIELEKILIKRLLNEYREICRLWPSRGFYPAKTSDGQYPTIVISYLIHESFEVVLN